MRQRSHIAGLVIVAAAAALPAAAGGVDEWSVYAGSFNATKSQTAAEAGFELRFPTSWPDFQTVAGVAGTEDGSYWVYGGGRYLLELGERWALAPGFAISRYEKGEGKNLGGALEFRSSIELSYRLDGRSRLGFNYYHLSNAGFYSLNPGSNSAVLTWSVKAGGNRDSEDGGEARVADR